jgi:hypothetical protein
VRPEHEKEYTDKEELLEILNDNPFELRYASNELKKDREVALKAVSLDGLALEYVHYTLKNDIEIAIEAIREDTQAIALVGEDIKQNRRLVAELASCYDPDDFYFDRDDVLEMIDDNPLSLMDMDYVFRDDEEIVMAAIRREPTCWFEASYRLMLDVDVSLCAIESASILADVNVLGSMLHIVTYDPVLMLLIDYKLHVEYREKYKIDNRIKEYFKSKTTEEIKSVKEKVRRILKNRKMPVRKKYEKLKAILD